MADIRQVAAKAGVSPATVSRVLNGHPHVSAETRAAVLRVIKAENYRPSQSAKALRNQRVDLVGYLHFKAPELQDGRMAEAAETVLFNAGFKTFSCNSNGDPAREEFYISAMIDQQVAGVILSAQGLPDRAVIAARRLEASGVPAIVLNPPHLLQGIRLAALDPEQIWACGWSHLLECKVEKSLVLLESHQALHAKPEGLSVETQWLPEGQEALPAVETVLHSWQPGPNEALYCGSEAIAVAALRVLKRRGVAVPRDISVLAMGGSGFAQMTVPRLTVVSLPLDALARVCATELLARIEGGPSEVRKIFLEAALAEGETTKRRSR